LVIRRALLEAAIKLRCSAHLSAEQRGQSRKGLQLAAKALLAQPRSDPAEESLRARLWKQRNHLLVFLDHPGVDPTNNLAERQLRPAVIARKLSCGNKTLAGATLGKSLLPSPSPAPSAPAASSTSWLSASLLRTKQIPLLQGPGGGRREILIDG
jgi:hypothetical protein